MSNLLKVNGILQFPNIVTPDSKFGQYSITVKVDEEQGETVQKAVDEVLKQAFPKEFEQVRTTLLTKNGFIVVRNYNKLVEIEAAKIQVGVGNNDKLKAFQSNVGFCDIRFNLRDPRKIIYYNKSLSKLSFSDELANVFYAGATVTAVFDLFSYDNKYGKGVGTSIKALQLVENTPAISTGTSEDDILSQLQVYGTSDENADIQSILTQMQ